MNIFTRIKEYFEPKDCEHGYHYFFEEIHSCGLEFPLRESIKKCKCGLEQYKLYDCYMGGILRIETGHDIDLDKIHDTANEKEVNEYMSEVSTEDGRYRIQMQRLKKAGLR